MSFLFWLLIFKSSAAEGVSLPVAQKIWAKYQACAKQGQIQLVACAKEYIDSNLSLPVRQKLIVPLDMGLEFSDLQECEPNANVSPSHLKPNETAYCMTLKGREKTTAGYVIFIDKSPKALLVDLRYKY